MIEKICTKCNETKPIDEFYKHKRTKDGHRPDCKACVKQYHQANRDHIREQQKQYREANRDQILEQKKHYYEANKDRAREYYKQYHEANKEANTAKSARRRALKRNQTPELTPEEQALIRKYYTMCKFLGADKYHVDHIIPLAKGGLHHPDNLQILSAEDNLRKQDKINYDYRHPRIRITDCT